MKQGRESRTGQGKVVRDRSLWIALGWMVVSGTLARIGLFWGAAASRAHSNALWAVTFLSGEAACGSARIANV